MEENNNHSTTVRINVNTKKRIEALGLFSESWDELLNRLAKIAEDQRLEELSK
jgi:hypothetical protein